MRHTIAIVIACASLVAHGCSSSAIRSSVRMFDRPMANRPAPRNSNLLFNPTPGGVDPSSFVRTDWPSTPHKWTTTSEEVRWREMIHDRQGAGYGNYGNHHGGYDRYHRVFRSDRRGRATANR